MATNWQQIASLAELGGNVALTFLGGAGIVPANSATIAAGVEAAVNPLLLAIQGNAPVATDIQAGYGALIGSLSILKSKGGLDPAALAKATEYLTAAEDGFEAYLTEQAGFVAGLFVVNAPMTPAI
jgi:hypothetical protein